MRTPIASTGAAGRPAWHALLAPLPAEAVPVRQPVAPPEVLARPEGAAVAGWRQLVLHLSAGAAGSRTLLVVLDATGVPLAASDGVYYREAPAGAAETPPCDAPARVHSESVGGSFAPDGAFRGTHWHSVALDDGRDGDLAWDSSRAVPSDAQVEALTALVAELVRRQPPPESGPP